jgi:hypothetical protein
MIKTAEHGTCSLWFEYETASAFHPAGDDDDYKRDVAIFAEAFGYAMSEIDLAALIEDSKEPRSVLMVSSDLADGPEMLRRSVSASLLPHAINLVTASGDGRPTAAETKTLGLIRGTARGVIPVYWAE